MDRKEDKFLLCPKIADYHSIDYRGVELNELLSQAKNGDDKAEEEVFNRIKPILDFIAGVYGKRYKTIGIDDGDILHSLFLAAKSAIHRYDMSKGEFENYFRKTISLAARWNYTHHVRSQWYKESVASISLSDIEQVESHFVDHDRPTTPLELEEKIMMEERINEVYRIIDGFKREEDKTIVRMHLAGYSGAEIGRLIKKERVYVYRHLKKHLDIISSKMKSFKF